MPGINAYREAVQANTHGRVVSSDDGARLKTRNATKPGKAWIAITRNSSRHGENVRTVDNFIQALRQEYGYDIHKKTVGDHNLEQMKVDKVPLTKAKVLAALLQAETMKACVDIRAGLERDFGKCIVNQAIAEVPGPAPNTFAMAEHLGAAVRQCAKGLLDTATTNAKGALSAAKVERNHNMNALAPAQASAVLRAMNNVATPDAQRAGIYQEFLAAAVSAIAPRILDVDPSDDGNLLTKVAGEIAKKLDEYVLETVFQHFQDLGEFPNVYTGTRQFGAYEETMRTLLSDGGFTVLAAKYPSLGRVLALESAQLAESLGEIAANFKTDLADVNSKFFNGADPVPTGLTDIRLTASDPHRGGRRVAILTLNGGENPGDRKVVYKPRDIRIDAKLVGSGNGEAIGKSMAEKLDEMFNTPDFPMPTYKFLAKSVPENEETHHHGYVQHLSLGTEADNQLTADETKAFYRNFGRQAAMLMLFGARDLHHTNIFVSGKQPYFTDLELSLDEAVLDAVNKGENDAPLKSQISMALTSTGEIVRRPRVTIEAGKLTVQRREERVVVTENRVFTGGSSTHNAAIRIPFAGDFDAGFTETIDALRAAMANGDFDPGEFVEEFQGMHMRYHPISTGENLAVIDGMKKDALVFSPEEDLARRERLLAEYLERRADRDEPIAKLHDAYIADWANRDVPYFTRKLGSKQVLHNAVDAIEVPREGAPENTDYFTGKPLDIVKGILAKLGDDEEFAGKLKAMGAYLGEAMRR